MDVRIGADHHPARRDVPDQAKLAAALDHDRADAQQAEMPLASAPLGFARGGCRQGVDCGFDGFFFHARLRRSARTDPHPSPA